MKSLFLALSLAFFAPGAMAKPTNIQVAIIDWCPQICIEGPQRGYIIDILELFGKEEKLSFNYNLLPWSRGIDDTRRGVVDVLLAPTKTEAPQLHFPQQHVGIQQMCFYGLKENSWRYTGPESITATMLIAAEQEASLGELEPYLKKNPHNFAMQPIDHHWILVQKVVKKQADVMIYTSHTMRDYIKGSLMAKDLEEKGCLNREYIFTAFKPTNKEWAKNLAERFDQFMERSHANGTLEKVMRRYHITDWK